MVFDVFELPKPINTSDFVIFRYLEIIIIDILMILRQILFNKFENSIFFENFLRNGPKFIFLWKIIILRMS